MIKKEIMDLLTDQEEKFLDKAKRIETLCDALKWFMSYQPGVKFHHQDLRGELSIILATKEFKFIDVEKMQRDFEKHPNYNNFKKYNITFGKNLDRLKTVYYYISSNDMSHFLSDDIVNILKNRVNSEVFPHIDNYFT